MMEKFDSIYADSVNDEIEFDVVFGGEGSLIESVDPDYFFDESGNDILDESSEEIETVDESIDTESELKENETRNINTIDDLDSYVEDIEDIDSDNGYTGYQSNDNDEDDDDDEDDDKDEDDNDDYYGDNHNYSRDDWEDKEKYHDNDIPKCDPDDCEEKEPVTVNDLDNRIARYDVGTHDYDKQVVHSSETDEPRDIKTVDDLDRYTNKSFNEDEDEDNALIDKVDNDDGAPDEDATPADFHRPEDNYQDNGFEVRDELKESQADVITVSDLDFSIGLIPTGQSTLGDNIGLETEESENPDSVDALIDGEDIDAIMDESFFEFF